MQLLCMYFYGYNRELMPSTMNVHWKKKRMINEVVRNKLLQYKQILPFLMNFYHCEYAKNKTY